MPRAASPVPLTRTPSRSSPIVASTAFSSPRGTPRRSPTTPAGVKPADPFRMFPAPSENPARWRSSSSSAARRSASTAARPPRPRRRPFHPPLAALDGTRPAVLVLLSALPCRRRIPPADLFLRDLGDHGVQPRFLSRHTRRQRLDLAAGIADAGPEVADLLPPRTQALLDPIDLKVEGVDLLPPPARGGFTLLELQPQPFEVGLVGGQTRQRRHLLGPQPLQRRHGHPAIVVEGKQPPPRQGQAFLLELFDETLVAPGLARLPPEGMDLLVHLHHDVVDAEKVGLCGLKFHLGLPPLRLVTED